MASFHGLTTALLLEKHKGTASEVPMTAQRLQVTVSDNNQKPKNQNIFAALFFKLPPASKNIFKRSSTGDLIMTLKGGYSKKKKKLFQDWIFLFLTTTTARPLAFYALFVKPVS